MKRIFKIYRWIVANERITLLLLLVIIVGAASFLSLADEVLEGENHQLDQRILLSMRTDGDPSDPLGPSWFEEAARDITALGSVVVLTIFTSTMAAYLYFKKQPWIALFVVIAVLSGTAISGAMKSGFNRPRPELVPHQTRIYTKSFPSGHSAISSLVYLTLGAILARSERDRKTRMILIGVPICVSMLVGLSRVYLGVHWPTDVLAGWLFGVTWAAACWLIFKLIQRRYHLPVESSPQP